MVTDTLLTVLNRTGASVIADMTGTASCDHSGVEAIARACQRAAISGIQVRLVVTAPVVRRVLAIEGLDRMVPIYPSLEAATEAEHVPGAAEEGVVTINVAPGALVAA